ncbi:RusA family crossover junction endodeoxyribonuclease [Microbacterium thalli]|uniref:RusA family crossover junction endodeoxyribonuclease n=1 Tax=Microbacterium thalli TaxID=3027921 RepID=UPI002366CB57|nr:RusA family crossover junction endodeoxyribonuclease [Microbacterium thalli]MDD7930114.1 RusA family crossover junction endodeoxyribonuclease [Microbacterium thalli]
MTGFFVAGVPVQQGSKTAFVVGKRAVLTDSNKAQLKPWRAGVARVAQSAWWAEQPLDGAVQVSAVFVMPRGKSVTRELPSVTPDLDKLIRALLDGVTDAGNVWRDDAQVVRLVVEEVYGPEPGVHVDIAPIQRVAVLAALTTNAATAALKGIAS